MYFLNRYLDAIERAVSNGDCLLLENIMESVDPVLDSLLGRLTIKKGRYIKIGDREVEYHPKYVQTPSSLSSTFFLSVFIIILCYAY